MFATRELVDSFREHALTELEKGEAVFMMDEMYDRWREEKEQQETIRDIKTSMEQFELGESMTLEEGERQIRQELGFPCRDVHPCDDNVLAVKASLRDTAAGEIGRALEDFDQEFRR